MSTFGTIRDATTGLTAAVTARGQTPTGNALQVVIGPADVVNNITPVFIDWEHHQLHEGESYEAQDVQLAIGASTVKYGVTIPTYANVQQVPHMYLNVDVYNGVCLIQIYETATFTSGSLLTVKNKNRNVAVSDGTTVTTGVTSTNGTLLTSFFAGSGRSTAGATRASNEWVMKNNTIYRVDVIGQAAGTQAVIGFEWYADLGV